MQAYSIYRSYTLIEFHHLVFFTKYDDDDSYIWFFALKVMQSKFKSVITIKSSVRFQWCYASTNLVIEYAYKQIYYCSYYEILQRSLATKKRLKSWKNVMIYVQHVLMSHEENYFDEFSFFNIYSFLLHDIFFIEV